MTDSFAPPTHHLGVRRVALLVLGAIAGLLALALVAAGGVLLYAHGSKRDAAGFYASGTAPIQTATHGFVSDALDVGDVGPDWLFRQGRFGTVRVTATSAGRRPIFVGVGPRAQVKRYLRSVAVERVTGLEVGPLTLTSKPRPGGVTPSPPGAQGFWVARSSGKGRQSVIWPIEQGSWSVVVMNADGTRGVRVELSVGAKFPLVLWSGIGLLCLGGFVAVTSGALIYLGARSPVA